MAVLIEDGLLSNEENEWLSAAMLGSRPMVVIGWISAIFDEILTVRRPLRMEYLNLANSFILEVKAGVLAMMNILGAPFPFMYVHAIYWVCQVSLVVLSVETGLDLAIYAQRAHDGKSNGMLWHHGQQEFMFCCKA